jgi:23S rRNA pseudouridine1911/1915/1917 synthase
MLTHGVKILYEDVDWWIIHKPAGVVSQRGKLLLPSVPDILRAHLQNSVMESKGFVGIVHRLDTNVSGVMAVAKRPQAAKFFHHLLLQKQVFKEYRALVHSEALPVMSQCWIHKGVKVQQKLHCYSYFERLTGKSQKCKLEVEGLQAGKGLLLLRVQLITGVFHQIRAQCAAQGMPIVGDVKYGGAMSHYKHWMGLHAQRLSFKLRPGEPRQTFESPLPEDIQRYLQ